MKFLALIATTLFGAFIASCTVTSQVSLNYVPGPGHNQPGAPEFTTRTFVDRRDVGPTDLGTVRTQIGMPMERVQTKLPVGQIVTNAFGHGLQARGMLGSPTAARYVITGEVLDLYCQMVVRPYGYARARVTVTEAGSGRIIFSQVYEGERQGPAYLPGSGSPVQMLRDLVSGALQDVVDRALDDGSLRSKLGAGSGAPPSGPTGNPQFVPGML